VVVDAWRHQAARTDPAATWDAHVRAGVGVSVRGSSSYPSSFLDDPDPPAVLFLRGDPDVIVGPRVAIVGTRNATRYGIDVARQLGHDLASAGVAVVSGLALGIDGAAHLGALDAESAPPIAVVGSGLDRPYPWRNADLWRRVGAAGVVLGEYPLGSPPLAWHFPARNRLITALADIVVVVESREAGGSMITVDEAIKRGCEVMAVPGPVGAPSSTGTNHLLADGRAVVRDAVDVLVQLGMSDGARRSARERRAPPEGPAAVVLEALGWQPTTIDQLVLRSGLGLASVAAGLDELVDHGWVHPTGGWFERIAKPGG
jgi:DNA processing protein